MANTPVLEGRLVLRLIVCISLIFIARCLVVLDGLGFPLSRTSHCAENEFAEAKPLALCRRA